MKDVIYEGRWRRADFKEGQQNFILFPQGDMSAIRVFTAREAYLTIATPKGQVFRGFSPGGDEPCSVTVVERFPRNSEFVIIPDGDEDVITRVIFDFEERSSFFGLL